MDCRRTTCGHWICSDCVDELFVDRQRSAACPSCRHGLAKGRSFKEDARIQDVIDYVSSLLDFCDKHFNVSGRKERLSSSDEDDVDANEEEDDDDGSSGSGSTQSGSESEKSEESSVESEESLLMKRVTGGAKGQRIIPGETKPAPKPGPSNGVASNRDKVVTRPKKPTIREVDPRPKRPPRVTASQPEAAEPVPPVRRPPRAASSQRPAVVKPSTSQVPKEPRSEPKDVHGKHVANQPTQVSSQPAQVENEPKKAANQKKQAAVSQPPPVVNQRPESRSSLEEGELREGDDQDDTIPLPPHTSEEDEENLLNGEEDNEEEQVAEPEPVTQVYRSTLKKEKKRT